MMNPNESMNPKAKGEDGPNLSRIVIITGMAGEKFLGELHCKAEHKERTIASAVRDRQPVLLRNARHLMVRFAPTAEGIATQVVLLPIDYHRGPIDKYYVVPGAWYFPTEKDYPRITKLINDVEEMESAVRAEAIGLHLPHKGRGNGPLVG
jgi:hypothetical protein